MEMSKLKHGYARNGKRHPIYRTWECMVRRCTKPAASDYPRYGGRGINIYIEWLEFEPFKQWAESNGWKKGLTLDRENVNGDYFPDNCKWSTRKQQANNKRDTYWIEFMGTKMTISDALQQSGNIVPHRLAQQRISRGWIPFEAVMTPKTRLVDTERKTWIKVTT